MDLTGIISLELAAGSILVLLTVFFVSLRFQLVSLVKMLTDQHSNDQTRDQVLRGIVTAQTAAAKDHVEVVRRFESAARRGDKGLEVLEKISHQLTTLASDHEMVMKEVKHSAERVLDRMPLA